MSAGILIVEDENIAAMNLQRMLSKLGYGVSGVASTGIEAITEARSKHPDLVLMDVSLKGDQDGVVTAQQINKELGIPVVFLTAFTDADTVARVRDTDPFGFLVKPVEEKRLGTAIEIGLYRHQIECRLKAEIEARKNAEAKLKERSADLARSNRDLEQFAAIAAHDLRAPLRNVSCYVGLLAERLGSHIDAESRDFLDFALKGTVQMSEIIEDLLSYARLGQPDLSTEEVDLAITFSDVLGNLASQISEAKAKITATGLPVVVGNRTYFRLIFQNLLSNAIKYRGRTNPLVEICCEKIPGNYLFSVKDNGIGIPKKEAETVFELFRRLHPASEYSGHGIGLAMCKRIVESYRGKIWIESKGKGTTVFFALPLP